jgi:hypothetical protein
MSEPWYLHLLWILAFGAAGFAVTAIGSAWLRLPRGWLLVPYTIVALGLTWGYLSWGRISMMDLLLQNWVWGLAGAVVLGAFLVRNVLSQPASSRSAGIELAFDVVWSGVVYGAVDGILLSAVPVLAAFQTAASLGWGADLPTTVLTWLLALVASWFVTVAYHAGYAEFRGRRMVAAIVGNGIMSAGYLLTLSPLTAVLSHAIMHVAAVLRGPNTTVQLPPHYAPREVNRFGFVTSEAAGKR